MRWRWAGHGDDRGAPELRPHRAAIERDASVNLRGSPQPTREDTRLAGRTLGYCPARREEERELFDYICERLIPGCSHEDKDENEEELLERAAEHLRVHHTTDHFDEPIDETLKKVGVQFVRPV